MAKQAGANKKAAEIEKDPEVKIENALSKTEIFFEKNWKALTAVVVVILVLVGGVYAYQGLYLAPKGKKAADAMYVAQQLFAQEDYATALNGDGNNLGFADVADNYSGTRQARLAAHYAGICSLKEGDADAALEYLSKYKATKGVPNAIINAQNEGLKADIYAEKGDLVNAVKHYQKAVAAGDNVLTTPMYLKKLGMAHEAAGNFAEAVKAYRKVADNYPTSLEARDIEKYASAAEQKM